ncbi:MAG: methyltransferase domain-containing protein [Caulobacter sp.]|nr:methyltransferase domain-containing protein [Caulobacter sp.]
MSRAPTSAKRPGWQWTEYWRGGHPEVMTLGAGPGRKAFDAAAVWLGYFETFASGARLLDLATGGGQVAGFASDAARAAGKTFEVIGVDHAELAPTGGPAAPGCTLMGSVALEQLPFPDAHFDGASSQFGIEYAERRQALGELARVLKPGGRALMLIHHADSAITRATAGQAAAYDRVFADGGALRLARRAFSAHLNRLPPDATRAAEEAFREAVRRMAARLEPSPDYEPTRYLTGYLNDLAQRIAAYEPASALSRIDAFEFGNASWRQRHRSQLGAAMDGAALDAFLQRADRVGLALSDRSEARDDRGELVAWRVALNRT